MKIGGDPFAQLVDLISRDQAAALDNEDRNQKRQTEHHRGAPGSIELALGCHLHPHWLQSLDLPLNPPALMELVQPRGHRKELPLVGETVGQRRDRCGTPLRFPLHFPSLRNVILVRPDLDLGHAK